MRSFYTALCQPLGLMLLVSACSSISPGLTGSNTVELQLLALNDFHGSLEAPASGNGGITRVATLVQQRKAGHRHSLVVGAGDLIGASPLLSSRFHDEPTIEALGSIGMVLSAVGNHEFDEGVAELQRLQRGGCHPVDGCQGPEQFQGASFQYLAANVIDTATDLPILPARSVQEFDGIPVGFIGLTLEATPSLIAPAFSKGLRFLAEADTINRETAALRAEGIEAIVVLIHEGGYVENGPEDCASLSGPITTLVPQLDKAVDVIISGHTHESYNCRVDGRLLTSSGRYGSNIADIALSLDRQSGDVVSAAAELIPVSATLVEDGAVASLVDSYRTLAAPLLEREVGIVSAPLSNGRNAAGESMMGAVIADAMLASAIKNGEPADLALMNPGGVRSSIDVAGAVSYAQLFGVQPFSNMVVVVTLTGADIEAVLAQQFTNRSPYVLQVSSGFSYSWRLDASGAGTLVPGSITISGEPLQAGRLYRVATNDFLASGGDGFTAFSAASDAVIIGTDVDALEAYLTAHSPFTPPNAGRISLVP